MAATLPEDNVDASGYDVYGSDELENLAVHLGGGESKVRFGDVTIVEPEDIVDLTDTCPCSGGSETPSVTAGKDTKDRWALEDLSLTKSECKDNRTGAPCSAAPVVRAMAEFAAPLTTAGAAYPAPSDKTLPPVVAGAAAALKCDTESCVVTHPAFVAFAAKKLGKEALRANLGRFKVAGPRNSAKWLDNKNIDSVLQGWAEGEFKDFHPFPFAMMDFDKTGGEFADAADTILGLMKAGKKTFACVLNTDTSAGPGRHWVAVFVDCRPGVGTGSPRTIEYFNSTGRPPPRPVVAWMERVRAALKGNIPIITVSVTTVAHQQHDTECGPYSLFYIRRRLEKTPYTFFQGDKIPDEAMQTFRQYLFRAH